MNCKSFQRSQQQILRLISILIIQVNELDSNSIIKLKKEYISLSKLHTSFLDLHMEIYLNGKFELQMKNFKKLVNFRIAEQDSARYHDNLQEIRCIFKEI